VLVTMESQIFRPDFDGRRRMAYVLLYGSVGALLELLIMRSALITRQKKIWGSPSRSFGRAPGGIFHVQLLN